MMHDNHTPNCPHNLISVGLNRLRLRISECGRRFVVTVLVTWVSTARFPVERVGRRNVKLFDRTVEEFENIVVVRIASEKHNDH